MEYGRVMESRKVIFLFVTIIILSVSCLSKPDSTSTQNKQTVDPNFDPRTISRAQYDSTMEEVRQFIDNLNRIISSKNYNSWRSALSQEYFNEISSPEYLQHMSDQPAMKSQRIVLKTAQDYFTHIVVPSRANSRVDEIVFVDRNRVKAYTINTNRQGEEQRLRLYDLEKIGNSWKIIN